MMKCWALFAPILTSACWVNTSLWQVEECTDVSLKLEIKEFTHDVGDAEVEAFANKLPQSLVNLSLSVAGDVYHQSKVGATGLKALAEKLPQSLVNLTLDLAFTKVGDTGLKALAEQMPQSLTTLDLDLRYTDPKVGDIGLRALADHLPRSLESLTLNFRYTKVGDSGLKAFADKMPQSLTTLELNLFGTEVGDTGLKALAEKMPQSLTTFKLHLCPKEQIIAGHWDLGKNFTDGLDAVAKNLPESLHNLGIRQGNDWISYERSAGKISATLTTVVGDVFLEALVGLFPLSNKSLELDLSGAQYGARSPLGHGGLDVGNYTLLQWVKRYGLEAHIVGPTGHAFVKQTNEQVDIDVWLLEAVNSGDVFMTLSCIAAGADVLTKDNASLTPYDLAQAHLYELVADGKPCQEVGTESITTVEECDLAAKSVGKIDNDGNVPASNSFKMCGCTWDPLGSVELWIPPMCSTSGIHTCTSDGFAGCFCKANHMQDVLDVLEDHDGNPHQANFFQLGLLLAVSVGILSGIALIFLFAYGVLTCQEKDGGEKPCETPRDSAPLLQ